MVVVSDASPLRYLVLVGCADVLPVLYGEVFAPNSVVRELQNDRTPEPVRLWISNPPAWLQVVQPRLQPLITTIDLGDWERDAIALAQELSAELILMDDREGRERV